MHVDPCTPFGKIRARCCKDTDKAFPLRIEKRYLRPDTDDVERALYPWFKDARVKYVTLSGPILVEKAKDFAERLGVAGFIGSTGWLGRFRSHHGIKTQE